jgi:hypothetical protein
VTAHSLRVHVFLGALSAAALSLALVADAADARASAPRKERQRRRAILQEELDRVAPLWPGQPRAGLALPLRLRQPAVAQTPAAPKPAATVPPSGALANGERGVTFPIVKGARSAGILPTFLPPFPGPASPIR